jgi:hypothetical protein
MNFRTALKTLLVLVLTLPILVVVFGWVSGLLTALGDAGAAAVLGHVNTALRVVWLACLTGLVVVLALDSVMRGDE